MGEWSLLEEGMLSLLDRQTDSSSMAGTVRKEFRSYHHIGCVRVLEEEIPAHIAEVRESLFLYLSEGEGMDGFTAQSLPPGHDSQAGGWEGDGRQDVWPPVPLLM